MRSTTTAANSMISSLANIRPVVSVSKRTNRSYLENKVSKLEHTVTTTSRRYSSVKNYVDIEKRRANKAELSLTQKVEQHNIEIQKAMSLVVNMQMRRWTLVLPIICVVCLIILSIYLGCSIWGTIIPPQINVFDYIDSLSGSRNEFMIYLLCAVGSVYGVGFVFLYNRWLSKNNRERHRTQLKTEYYEKIRQ